MSKNLYEFNQKFRTKELLIYESNYWLWTLRPHQSTLGASVLSLKRECENLSDVEMKEFTDLKNIIETIEHTLSKCFNYDKINYLMLMMVDNQIHYHVIPRYKAEISFLGNVWKDSTWPKPPILSGETMGDESLIEIKKRIQKHLT